MQGKISAVVQVNSDEVVDEDVLDAAKKLIENNTPGPNGIPNIVLKMPVRRAPNMFDQVFTACLREGEFPEQWKLQKLIAILNSSKLLGDSSSYRSMCLVNTVGKLFDRVIYNRLLTTAEVEGGFTSRNILSVQQLAVIILRIPPNIGA